MEQMSMFDIPKILAKEPEAMKFIEKRVQEETFEYVKSLVDDESKKEFKRILLGYYNGEYDIEEAAKEVEKRINAPPEIKRTKRWGERLIRSEASKLFTLGYGDYLLSQGETECYIPFTPFDETEDCLRLIAGKTFSIRQIQENIYKNYALKKPIYPTVPLHPNCRHVITRVPK